MDSARRASWFALSFVFALACSSSSNNSSDGGTGGSSGGLGGHDGGNGDGSAASITLTSTALAAGAAFAAENTCAGVNTSPPLSWTAGPAGTMSYVVSLTDLSFNNVV